MTPELRRVGKCQAPVVVIDDFSGEVNAAASLANAMAPFPPCRHNLYPGLRRVITEVDAEAYAYVERLCESAAPFIAGAFDKDRFDLIEASFSLVTTPPAELEPMQRIPHFDSADPDYLALLHYVRVPPGTGTAFFRQRSTGIEQVTERNVASFIKAARKEATNLPLHSTYVRGSNELFEELDRVEAVQDRLLIYRGSLVHSGIIPPAMPLSPDPLIGRLTTNIFVQMR